MDNQQHKDLENTYNYLCRNTVSNTNDLCADLNFTKEKLTPIITELQKLGLDVSVDVNKVKLQHSIDIIDIDQIKSQAKILALNKMVNYQFITQSTNQLAQENKQDAIYISNYQSKGKGRQAKNWLTPLGQSIAISMSHKFNHGLQKLSGLNIAIGVAIIETLSQFGGQNMGLKWPNDVIGLKGKVAGILIEATGNTKSCRAIIGVGINWNIRQELLETVDQACSNAGIYLVSRTEFIIKLLLNMNQFIVEFTKNGLKNIQVLWLKHDVYINKNINLIQGDLIKPALYKGINSHGLLKVEMDKELKTLASGEVSIRAFD